MELTDLIRRNATGIDTAAVRPHGMRVFQQLWHAGHNSLPLDEVVRAYAAGRAL